MENFPQETIENISKFLEVSDLRQTLTVSQAIQHAADRFSRAFESTVSHFFHDAEGCRRDSRHDFAKVLPSILHTPEIAPKISQQAASKVYEAKQVPGGFKKCSAALVQYWRAYWK